MRDAIRGSTVRIFFTTSDAAGGAIDPSDAFEAADIDIYKDGSATQRSSTAGWTMTSPFDAVTGLHLIEIDLSDNTDAGFYEVGSQYAVVITPDETVDGQTVASVLSQFQISDGAEYYPDGWIYVDTNNGTAGTTVGVNGTMGNPTTTLASARTIAEALGIRQIRVVPGSSVTAASSFANYRIDARGSTLAYGSQSFDDAVLAVTTTSGSFTGTPVFVEDAGTISEEPSAVPVLGTATLKEVLEWVAFMHLTEINQTASATVVRDIADTSDIGTAAYSNDGATVVRGAFS